jgi:cephalosporin hydroxylase
MIQSGTHVINRDQPPLSADERDIVDRFHALYYQRYLDRQDTIELSWFGYKLLKCPLDLWIYQELIVRTRPDVIVETGTYYGGSALFLAMLLDQIGAGSVLTIDVTPQPGRPAHPRIEYLLGSSTDRAIADRVRAAVAGRRAMVILDSDHSAAHVHAEMTTFAPLVQMGDYMVVEDTNVNGHPAWPSHGPGPMEAIERFLNERHDFVVDPRCERFLMTLNPRGYLRRVGYEPPPR